MTVAGPVSNLCDVACIMHLVVCFTTGPRRRWHISSIVAPFQAWYQQSSHSRTQHFLEGNILGRHAHGMVHMEASRCDHLRQCTTQLSSFTSLDTIRTEGKEWVTMGASALARYYRRWTNLALDVSCCN